MRVIDGKHPGIRLTLLGRTSWMRLVQVSDAELDAQMDEIGTEERR